MTEETFDSSTTWTCPPGVTTVQVECWGAGGSGGTVASARQAGGGGGAYARKNSFSVTPGNSYTVHVGTNAGTNGNGGDTWFDDGTQVLAKGGTHGGNSGGAGGVQASCIGDVVHAGGPGGARGDLSSGTGGGGGGSATSTAVGGTGGNGQVVSPFNGGAGGAGEGAGGKGADGVTSAGHTGAAAGSAPGGGGGGSGNPAAYVGANGAAGRIVLTYTAPALLDFSLVGTLDSELEPASLLVAELKLTGTLDLELAVTQATLLNFSLIGTLDLELEPAALLVVPFAGSIDLELEPAASLRSFGGRIPQGQSGLLVFKPDWTMADGLEGPIALLHWKTSRRENALTTWEATIPVDDQLVAGVPVHTQIKTGWHVCLVQDGNHPLNDPSKDYLLYMGKVMFRKYERGSDKGPTLTLSGVSRNTHLVERSTRRGLSFSGQGMEEIADALIGIEFETGTSLEWTGPNAGLDTPAGAFAIQPTVRFNDQSRWDALLKADELARYSLRESWNYDNPSLRRIDDPPDSGIRLVKVESADQDIRFYAADGLGAITDGAPVVSYDGMRLVNRIIPYGSDTVADPDNPPDGTMQGDLTLEHASTSAPYAVEEGTNPDGTPYWYLEDAFSIARYGLSEIELFRTDVKNPSDDAGTRTAAANVLYAVAAGELLSRKSELISIVAPVVNGADIWALPGDFVWFDYTGWARDLDGNPVVWLDENRRMLISQRDDESDDSGVRKVTFTLIAPEIEMRIPDLPDAIILPPKPPAPPGSPDSPPDSGPDVPPGDMPTSADCCDDTKTDTEDGAEPPPSYITDNPPEQITAPYGGTGGVSGENPDETHAVLIEGGIWAHNVVIPPTSTVYRYGVGTDAPRIIVVSCDRCTASVAGGGGSDGFSDFGDGAFAGYANPGVDHVEITITAQIHYPNPGGSFQIIDIVPASADAPLHIYMSGVGADAYIGATSPDGGITWEPSDPGTAPTKDFRTTPP